MLNHIDQLASIQMQKHEHILVLVYENSITSQYRGCYSTTMTLYFFFYMYKIYLSLKPPQCILFNECLLCWQIDFLQQKTRELDRKYQDSNAVKEDLEVNLSKSRLTIKDQEAQIKELELDLRDIDRTAKRLESDKNHVVRTADREMMEAKVGVPWNEVQFCNISPECWIKMMDRWIRLYHMNVSG